MQNEVRPPEHPLDLLAWLAALERDSVRILQSLSPDVHAGLLAGLASELPGYLDGVLLREAPEEDFDRRAWLAQLARLEQARQGCSLLDPGHYPWAPGLARQLAEVIALRAPAAQALRDALAAEDEELDEEPGDFLEKTPQTQAWETLRELRQLARVNDLNDERDLQKSCELAAALAEKPWVEAFREASEAFRKGQDERQELISWIAHGLEARLLLEGIAAELMAPELFQALERVDEALRPYGDALALLPEQDYEEIASFGGFPRGWASWREFQERVQEPKVQDVLLIWGKQERRELDERIAGMMHWLGAHPRLGVLQAANQSHPAVRPAPGFEPMAAAAATDDALRLLEQLEGAPQASYVALQDQLSRALQRMPCVWLRQDLKRKQEDLAKRSGFSDLASFLSTRLRLWPGNVPLLVAISGAFAGDVWQLRIHRRNEPGDPWERAGVLQTIARDAIRAAFDAAAACMPHGLPPYPFEEHGIELVGGGHTGIQAIDGGSVGLAATLAFVSLWLDASLPEDIACTATVRAGGKLDPVGYVREKAEALARLAQRPVRLVLGKSADGLPEQIKSADGLPEQIKLLVCASVVEALEKVGLKAKIDEAAATYRPWMGSIADRHEMLARYHRHVEQQMLADYQGKGLDPWLVLGDRIRLLVRSLETTEDVQTRQQVAQSRADAALAFTHGLDESSARDMLRDLDLSRASPSVAVFAGIVELGSLLDRCIVGRSAWGELDAPSEKLEAGLENLSQADRDLLAGRVLGTIGRAWMHQRKLPQAVDYLRRAVAFHDEHLWQEAGRSRIYLATVLRMAGDLEEAVRTLEAAGALLDRCDREYSPPYAEHTRLFWDYEFARLLLDLERPLDAIEAIEARLPQARQVGPWPLAGMLRTLAWAARAAGLRDRHEEALCELDRIAGDDDFRRALYREAVGPFRRDGEVYLDLRGKHSPAACFLSVRSWSGGGPVAMLARTLPSTELMFRPLPVFVATRLDQVPPGLSCYLSVDGSVPGAALRWDHHVTGERINLDAMPEYIETAEFDGVGTTLADADALASVVAVLFGGKARLPQHDLAVLEAASHWCDHLAPHPGRSEGENRLGRGLLDAINEALSSGDPSVRFSSACLHIAGKIQRGEPLPFSDHWERQRRLAEQLDLAGKIRRDGSVAVVDLRGAPAIDPLATYQRLSQPVALVVDEHPRGGVRYTVGVNPTVPAHPEDLGPALKALAAAEFAHGPPCLGPDPVPGNENWGGRRTVFGSPWNYGSRLGIDEALGRISAALEGHF